MCSTPLISVVIPTYNRPQRLAACLQSLTQLDYPRDQFEVIVVDDGSPEPLTAVTEPFQTQIGLRLLRQDNSGPASARNAGAASALGKYLAFTDDDCQVTADWLTALTTTLANQPHALIGGHTVNALPENIYSTASQLLIDFLYSYYNPRQGTATFFASNNFALPRDMYQTLGGFDTGFPLAAGEDREFCDRWLQQGLTMVYAPAMIIHHTHHLSLGRFWRQHFNYGRGAYCFHQARSSRGNGPVRIEPAGFYQRLLTYPLSAPWNLQQIKLVGLMLVSQVANAAGFFWERQRQKARLQPLPVHPVKG